MKESLSFDTCLGQWLCAHSLGRRDRTQEFNTEIVGIIRTHWPDPAQTAASVTTDDLLGFATRVTHYCPSRWNAIVSALRFVTPGASLLKRRRLRIRQFTPPTHAQFSALLVECDAARRSHAGLVVRFLSFTGLRISEARRLRWPSITPHCIEVAAAIAKNGVARSVPLLPGIDAVLGSLRAVAGAAGLVLPPGNPRKAIASACRRAGIAPLSPHCFRHLFATRCIESGVDIPTVARWLGHQDGGALLSRTYFHLVDEHSRRMAEKVRIAA
jgi:integrase